MICKIFVNDSKCSLSFFKETYAPADLRNCKQAVGTGISTATGFASRDWIKEMVPEGKSHVTVVKGDK